MTTTAAHEGLTEERVEELRRQIGDEFDDAITLSGRHMNALCDLALLGLRQSQAGPQLNMTIEELIRLRNLTVGNEYVKVGSRGFYEICTFCIDALLKEPKP